MALDPPLVRVTGRLVCADATQMMLALDLLPDHVAASRAEPGCLRFVIAQDAADPLVFALDALFAGDAAFAAHQARARASRWGRESAAIRRDVHRDAGAPVARLTGPLTLTLAEGSTTLATLPLTADAGTALPSGAADQHPALAGRDLDAAWRSAAAALLPGHRLTPARAAAPA